ncbi:hypothetical protein [Streptomyces sp. TRM64462]|uniref:hypothetical protein n=1 Tax=Streptomyces sp. TRM64462 TaxID=2741726 RepID=UPI001586B7EF|nr:hypothetical protein [Streptomyces sp. TRM64462]
MEAELVALATAGATALVQQMVGDGWAGARTRVAAFLARRSGRDADAVDAELDDVRDELVAAQNSGDADALAAAREEALVEWRARMRRTLRDDPEAAAELRALIDELAEGPAQTGQAVVEARNTISGGVQHGTVIQTGSIGSLNLGDPRRG